MANLTKVARAGFSAAIKRAKEERKPLELWPKDTGVLDISDLPTVYSGETFPGLNYHTHYYLDYRNGGFYIDDIRDQLQAGRFYAITHVGEDWLRVSEYVRDGGAS